MQDPFQILGLRRSWQLTADEIRAAQRRRSIASHPDRHADLSARTQAVQESSIINSAAGELLDPLTRGDAILRALVPEPKPKEPRQDPMFLTRIMQLREALDEAGSDAAARDAAVREIEGELRAVELETASAMEALIKRSDSGAWLAAFDALNRLRALRRARVERAR